MLSLIRRGDIPSRTDALTLLLVDDDPACLRAWTRAFSVADPSVEAVTADSGNATRAVLRKKPGRPPLVGMVTDWHLGPGDTGGDLVRWFDIAYPKTPILIMSGLEDVTLPEKFSRARDIRFVRKGAWRAGTYADYCRAVFLPQARNIRDRRAWLAREAGLNACDLREHHIRTLEALFDSVDDRHLAEVRNLSARSCREYLRQTRMIFGVTAHRLKSRYERSLGRADTFPPRQSDVFERVDRSPIEEKRSRVSARRNRR